MKKLALHLDELDIESFEIAPPAMNVRGTIAAHGLPNTGELIDQMISWLVCP
jgi:hypothetical protein